jgi:N-terminal domain of anti-restriction factor ArdC
MPVNALTQNVYNGIKVVGLWVSAELKSYATPVWATYKQWSELGAQVRKDEKSSIVIFYKEFEADPDPDDASDGMICATATRACRDRIQSPLPLAVILMMVERFCSDTPSYPAGLVGARSNYFPTG